METESSNNVLARFATCLAAGDAVGAANIFAEDALYEELPRFRFEGRAALLTFFADFAARHTDAEWRVTRALADPTGAVSALEWHWRYRVAGDGTMRAFAGMCFITFKDDLIASWRGYSTPVEA